MLERTCNFYQRTQRTAAKGDLHGVHTQMLLHRGKREHTLRVLMTSWDRRRKNTCHKERQRRGQVCSQWYSMYVLSMCKALVSIPGTKNKQTNSRKRVGAGKMMATT
jgi:hypothetical protein